MSRCDVNCIRWGIFLTMEDLVKLAMEKGLSSQGFHLLMVNQGLLQMRYRLLRKIDLGLMWCIRKLGFSTCVVLQ